MAEKMSLHDVVTKLIGPVNPVGETRTDDERYDNLKAMIELVDHLLGDIDGVSTNKDRAEFSMSRAGRCASKFFDSLGIEE